MSTRTLLIMLIFTVIWLMLMGWMWYESLLLSCS